MTSLLRFLKYYPKTINYCYRSTSVILIGHTSCYHNNSNPCNKKLPTQIVSRFRSLDQRKLLNSNRNASSVDLFTVQRRHFSLGETLQPAFTAHTTVFRAISESSVVQYTQNFIVDFHNSTGLPWWLSIIVTTCLVRCFITLPLAIYQSYVIARLENVRKEIEEIANNLRYEVDREIRNNRLSEKKARAHLYITTKKEWKRLIERDNCHPVKASILALIQIPTWVIFSTSFRNLVSMAPHHDTAAALTRLGLSLGGLPWCTDLTVSDSFVIPIALGITNLAIVEVQAMMYQGKKTRLQRYLTNFFRCFAVFMVPVSATVPSAVSLYWLTSSVFGLCQNLLVVSPRLRRLLSFPPTASYNPHPYSHLAQQIKTNNLSRSPIRQHQID